MLSKDYFQQKDHFNSVSPEQSKQIFIGVYAMIVHFIYLPQKNIFIIASLLSSMLINIITMIMYGDDLETSSQCCITYLMGLEPFRQISPKKSDFIQSLDRLTQLD